MFDFATLDLTPAIAHHLLVFLLAGILAFEIGVIRSTMTAADIKRVGSVDIWYGILAALIIVVGFSRAIFAAKGWAYYSVNLFFWAKMACFCRCRVAVDHADDAHHSMAANTRAQGKLRSGRRRHSLDQALSLGGGDLLLVHCGVRRGDGARLWFAEP